MTKRAFIFGALIALLVQTVLLGKILYDRMAILSSGEEVILQSRMVDPRDLFRGHYVRLNLNVGQLEKDSVEVDATLKRNNRVFVELAKGGGQFWIAKKLHAKRPENPLGPILEGKLRAVPSTSGGSYRIDFPFDRFFADKKRAKELENSQNKGQLGVILALDGSGSGAIKGITVDGTMIYDEPIF